MKKEYKSAIFAIVLLATFILIPTIAVICAVGRIPSISELSFILYDQGGSHNLFDSAINGLIGIFNGLIVIVIMTLAASLLFNVTFWKKNISKSQTFWKIYLGYFVLTVFLLSMFVYDKLYTAAVPNLWGTYGAFIIVTFTVILGSSIFICRLLYKLPLDIEKTNVGSFVIVLFISYAFFKLLTEGFNPINFWLTAIKVEPVNSFANALFLIIIPAIFCFALALIDRLGVERFKRIVKEIK